MTSSDPAVAVELDGAHLILRPAANWYGTAQITVTATNSEPGDNSDSETVTLTVASVNDAPVLARIPDQTIAVGGTLVLDPVRPRTWRATR